MKVLLLPISTVDSMPMSASAIFASVVSTMLWRRR